MERIRVLFVCVHNSGRSQMAEAYLNAFGTEIFQAESAGLSPQPLNPLVVEVMREEGFDLSKKKAHAIFDYFKEGRLYDYVITVCDDAIEGQCPVFPGVRRRIHWPFKDPAGLEGTYEEKLAETRGIRDEIRARVEQWVKEMGHPANDDA